jgi:peptidoglycan/xylan/chitin deacetylase (PgdA/CDA1 family)
LWSEGAWRWVEILALLGLAGTAIGLGVSFPQLQFFGRSLCRVSTNEKAAALTFDDGPDPRTTPALLDLLAKRGVRATFFCIGKNAARHPDLVRRIVAEGHRIENHSYAHDWRTNLFSVARLREDLSRAQQEIEAQTGRAPRFFRPPAGLTNPRVFRVAKELGLRVAGYTARGLDRRDVPPEVIVGRLMRGARPGAILLMHDGGVDAERMLAAVSQLLDQLAAAGFSCCRLDELAEKSNPCA